MAVTENLYLQLDVVWKYLIFLITTLPPGKQLSLTTMSGWKQIRSSHEMWELKYSQITFTSLGEIWIVPTGVKQRYGMDEVA